MQVSSDLSLAELQDNVICVITAKINERADQTDEAVKHNTMQIEGLKKSLEFCHQEVVDLKKENSSMKVRVEQMQKKVTELEQKVNDADRAESQQVVVWSLCECESDRSRHATYGVAEEREENVKVKVKEICCAAIPGSDGEEIVAAVDMAHRIGRMDSGQFPRPVIVRFTSRAARDAFWKGAKNNEFLKSRGFSAHSLLSALIKHWVDPRLSGLSPLDMRVHSTQLSSALQDARLYAWV
ncbi:hypothetical protein DPX16_19542 [Anabarilius grahami]|uniref:Uncharacterized protein n=1 Tax=Anabarilius grahami TaxID=495550 RepID=A0A3N0Y7B6_ANAGA|nr:hypothetical protein DPX16_19542 [Anabarilius grahami]